MKRFAIMFLLLFVFCGCTAQKLQPVDSDEHGFDGDYLYVLMDGKTYLYERQYSAKKNSFTIDELIDSFDIQTEVESVVWEVYTVTEHSDRSYLKLISGTNSQWIYKYVEK